MRFSLFNLEKYIHEYNKKLANNKKIVKDENFGFECLSYDAFQTLMSVNKQIADAPKLFCGLSGKNHDDFKKSFCEAIHQFDAKKFKEQIVLYRRDIEKQKNQKWYEQQQKYLSRHEFWYGLVEKFGSKVVSKILWIQKKWQTQKTYAHYNSLALKHVAENLFPIFEQYFELVKIEVKHKGNKLPKKILTALKTYLIQIEKELRHEKHQLCWALLGRLELASKKNDVHAEDVTVELADSLKEIGVIKPSAQLPEERRNLTSDCFEFFHRFIETHGNQLHKNRLKSLAWFLENEEFVSVCRTNHHLLVPKMLVPFVPEKPSLTAILLGGIKFRHQFLTNRLALISAMRLLDNQKFVVKSLKEVTCNSQLKNLKQIEKELISEYQKNKDFKPSLIQRLFQGQTACFINTWQNFLLSQFNKLLVKKVEFLGGIAEQVKTRLVFGIDTELLTSPSFKGFLALLVSDIEESAKRLTISLSMLQSYMESKKIILKILEPESTLSLKETPSIPSLQFSSNTMPHQNKAILNGNDLLSELKKVNELLHNCQQNDLVSLLDKNLQWISLLKDSSEVCKLYKDNDLQILLNQVMERFFVIFLQSCIQWKDEECKCKLAKVNILENMLLTIPQKSIRSRMASLSDLSSKEQWFLWKLKCESYLHSFNTDFNIQQNQKKETEKKLNGKISLFDSTRFFNTKSNQCGRVSKSLSNAINLDFQLRG